MAWDGERVDILGVGVSAIRMEDAVMCIERWIAERSRRYVCITGVHGVMECQSDAMLRTIHWQADMVTPDGMPLVWMSHWLGAPRVERVYGPDLMRLISAGSQNGRYRHFYYGGEEGVAERLAQVLAVVNADLEIVGIFSPPFRALTESEDDEIVRRINSADPDIVWVGLGTPKQEYWMAKHREALNAPVLIGVGAAFDFLAGTKKQAPRWLQRHGLEWVFRLASEPRRLGARYIRIVPAFLVQSLGQLLGLRRSDANECRGRRS